MHVVRVARDRLRDALRALQQAAEHEQRGWLEGLRGGVLDRGKRALHDGLRLRRQQPPRGGGRRVARGGVQQRHEAVQCEAACGERRGRAAVLAAACLRASHSALQLGALSTSVEEFCTFQSCTSAQDCRALCITLCRQWSTARYPWISILGIC